MLTVKKTVRICEMRIGAAELRRFRVHLLDKASDT